MRAVGVLQAVVAGGRNLASSFKPSPQPKKSTNTLTEAQRIAAQATLQSEQSPGPQNDVFSVPVPAPTAVPMNKGEPSVATEEDVDMGLPEELSDGFFAYGNEEDEGVMDWSSALCDLKIALERLEKVDTDTTHAWPVGIEKILDKIIEIDQKVRHKNDTPKLTDLANIVAQNTRAIDQLTKAVTANATAPARHTQTEQAAASNPRESAGQSGAKPSYAAALKAQQAEAVPTAKTAQEKRGQKPLGRTTPPRFTSEVQQRRLIIRFSPPLPRYGIPPHPKIKEDLNQILKSADAPTSIRINATALTGGGHLAVYGAEGCTSAEIESFGEQIANYMRTACKLTDSTTHRFQRDFIYYKTQLNGCMILDAQGAIIPSGLTIRQELIESNPGTLCDDDFADDPRWMASQQILDTKETASIVIALKNADLAHKISTNKVMIWFNGHEVRGSNHIERGPIRQCLNCQSYGHHTKACRRDQHPVCGICAGDHHTSKHKCATCGTTDDSCDHVASKCALCKESHVAWSTDCRVRKEALKTAKEAPKKKLEAQKAKSAQLAAQLAREAEAKAKAAAKAKTAATEQSAPPATTATNPKKGKGGAGKGKNARKTRKAAESQKNKADSPSSTETPPPSSQAPSGTPLDNMDVSEP